MGGGEETGEKAFGQCRELLTESAIVAQFLKFNVIDREGGECILQPPSISIWIQL